MSDRRRGRVGEREKEKGKERKRIFNALIHFPK